MKASLLAMALLATLGYVHGQSVIDGTAGIDMNNTGLITRLPVITTPTGVAPYTTNWETTASLQGNVVPVGQLTGLSPAGTELNYEDLLPLKVTKLTVTLGTPGAAPADFGTVIDGNGVDTSKLITDALFVVDSGTNQAKQFTLSNGELTLPGTIRFGTGGSVGSPYAGSLLVGAENGNVVSAGGAAVIGGNNNKATVGSATVIGGMNWSNEENVASGGASTIIGAQSSRTNSMLSSIIGGGYHKIEGGSNSVSSTIIGGQGGKMLANAGFANAIVGGNNNLIDHGGSFMAIVGGNQNAIENGGYGEAIVGGELLKLDRTSNSFLAGGRANSIIGATGTVTGTSGIVAGEGNTILAGSLRSAIVAGSSNNLTGSSSAITGGLGNNLTGNSSTIVGGKYAKILNGDATVALGTSTIAEGPSQLVIGQFHIQSHSADPGGKLFIIGNGGGGVRSNALSVDWNGKLETTTVKATAVESGSVEAVSVEAEAVTTQTLILNGANTSDISMGEFNAN